MRQPTEMTVPLVDLKAQYDSIRADVLAAITRVCDSQQFILGPEVELLEKELAEVESSEMWAVGKLVRELRPERAADDEGEDN